MNCNCEKAPEFPTKAFIPGPIEIPINFRAVTIPADQGDDRTNPPLNGAYRNVVLKYAANGHTYIYSSDGIPIALLVEVGDIEFNDVLDRPKYDGEPMTSSTNIPDLTDEVGTLQEQIQALATDFSYKGSVEDYAHLPADAATGDVYTTTDTGVIYVWDGNAWVALNEYPPVFSGTDGATDGTVGLVPAPEAADAGKVLGSSGNWEQNGPTIVQTTGASQTDVMSQDATTNMFWRNPTTKNTVQICSTRDPSVSGNDYNNVYIGSNLNLRTDSSCTDNVVIGCNAQTSGQYGRSVVVGNNAIAWGAEAVVIGYQRNGSSLFKNIGSVTVGANIGTVASYGIAIGSGNDDGTLAPDVSGGSGVCIGRGTAASAQGSVAIGTFAKASAQGEMNIGSTNVTYGYNSTNYRLLSGVHDPQNAHDAATKGYVDTKATITMTSTDPGEGGALAANNFIAVYNAS